jgi:hypothetical protein
MIYFASLFQLIGFLLIIFYSVSAVALSIYKPLFNQSNAVEESLAALSLLLGVSGVGIIIVFGFILSFVYIKDANNGSYFSNATSEMIGKIAIIPAYVGLCIGLPFIMVPFLAYRFYQYKKGIETDTVKFIKWAQKGWRFTLLTYILLVLVALVVLSAIN